MNRYLSRLVKQILIKDESCRDDVMKTLKEVHDRELSLWSYSKSEYYDAFFSDKLSNPETVGRLWRLIQEKFPELRGETWEERQKHSMNFAQQAAEGNLFQLGLFD
jgi:phenylacetate-coenzyme A ligase PaaK-like adenylate-forming protein